MTKYYVIAKKWDSVASKTVEYLAGEFTDRMNALLFKKAYNKMYSTDAYIREIDLF